MSHTMSRPSGTATPRPVAAAQTFTFRLTGVTIEAQDGQTANPTNTTESYKDTASRNLTLTLKKERTLRTNTSWPPTGSASPFELSYVLLLYAGVIQLVYPGLDFDYLQARTN